jgi:hypothetical protein
MAMNTDKLDKVTAVFLLVSAICLILIWTVLYLTGVISDFFLTLDFPKAFLLLSEFLCAALMATAGIGLAGKKVWAHGCKFFSLGMLSYALLIGSGQFIERRIFVIVILFGIVFAATVTIVMFNLLVIRTRLQK